MNCCGSDSQKEPKHQSPEEEQALHGAGEFGAGQAKNNSSADRRGIAKSSLVLGLALVLIAGMSVGYFIKPSAPSEDHLAMIKNKDVADQRTDFIALADNIKAEMAKQGKYNCCIEKPCTYCIKKTPGHGEGAACECMDNILKGEHPCGECIGEILEGHGEPELRPYFAKAIAHKVGEQHEAHLQEIIDDMYPED